MAADSEQRGDREAVADVERTLAGERAAAEAIAARWEAVLGTLEPVGKRA